MRASEGKTANAHARRFGQPKRPLATGVLHFGLGAFHRAHQAYFFDRLLKQGHHNWGVAAVNMRSEEIVCNLNAQDNIYTRWERGRSAEKLRTIGALTGAYHLPTMRDAVLDLFRSPKVHLITVTVSEKGYHFDQQAGALDVTHTEIQKDLASPCLATTLPGVLAQGLNERRKAKAGPITVASCDNYRNNGQVLKSVIYGFAGLCYLELAGWLEDNVSFPSSMVDGIVPKVRDVDRAEMLQSHEIADPALVIAEDYMRWVIEDDFAGDHPPLDSVGAEIVTDVGPFETMKLMLVNAPHSAVAYLGCLSGFNYVHEAVAHPSLRAIVDHLLRHELMPAAMDAAGQSASEYGGMTLKRFANKNIEYRTLQVAMDGSLKIQQRILPALSWHLSRGTVPSGLSLILASWIRFLSGVTDMGERYEISDPMAKALTARLQGAIDSAQIVYHILAMKEIFPAELCQSADLASRIAWHFDGMADNGTLPWLQQLQAQQMEDIK